MRESNDLSDLNLRPNSNQRMQSKVIIHFLGGLWLTYVAISGYVLEYIPFLRDLKPETMHLTRTVTKEHRPTGRNMRPCDRRSPREGRNRPRGSNFVGSAEVNDFSRALGSTESARGSSVLRLGI